MKKPANRCSPKFQRKRSRISRLAGFLPFIWSNLCTRHILNKLTPRGHEDWPDKRRRETRSIDWVSKRLHSLLQNRLRELAGTTQDERAKVFVPIAVRGHWSGAAPMLEAAGGRSSRSGARQPAPECDAIPHEGDQRTESSAMESVPNMERISSRPASFLTVGSFSSMKRW